MKKIILLLFLLCVPAFSSLIRPGFYPMHDDMQAMRLLQTDKCISDGQIPCRWVPDMGYGYGYPQFNYYTPLPYYVMWFFKFLGFGYLASVKAFIILTVIASAVGMYLLADSLWGRLGGLLSAVFYIYAPYRAVDVYVRGAIGELAAFSIIPFIFWSVKKLLEGDKKHVLYLALFFSTLLTSHNISALIFTPLIFLWALFLIYKKDNIKFSSLIKKLRLIGLAFLWGLGLSAFFVIPAFFEKNLVHIRTLTAGYFNYISHFVGIKDILFSSFWGYGSSQPGAYDDISFSVGLLHWTLPLVVLFLFLYLKRKNEFKTTLLFVILGFASLFMMHPRSAPIWKVFESLLSYIQFPWRFLLPSVFFFSLSIGGIGYLLRNKKGLSVVFSTILIFLVMLLNSYYFKPKSWLNIADSEKFSGESWQRQLTISIYDYLPIYAKKAPDVVAPDIPDVVNGQVEVLDSKRGSYWYIYKINSLGESTIRLPIYYFPNFRVYVNKEEVPIKYDNELGLITIDIENGENTIQAQLYNTPLRTVSNLISLAGVITIPLYIKKNKKR